MRRRSCARPRASPRRRRARSRSGRHERHAGARTCMPRPDLRGRSSPRRGARSAPRGPDRRRPRRCSRPPSTRQDRPRVRAVRVRGAVGVRDEGASPDDGEVTGWHVHRRVPLECDVGFEGRRMSSRRRRLRRRGSGGSAARIALWVSLALLALLLLGTAAGTATAYAFVRSWLKDLPDYESPSAFQVAQATKIYSADGKLLARLYLENRTIVPFENISQDLKDGLIAVEDERYYQHRGVDPVGIVRAAVMDVLSGSVEEGASTITMQYVRNTILADERFDISAARKVREAFVAQELEKRRTKDEILNLYLNTVYFGEGAYGAEAAAQTYFAKHAEDLTLGEASLLAGLPQAPSRLDPYDNPEAATARRVEVLDAMLANNYISQAEYDQAISEPVKLTRAKEPEHGIYRAHYFVAHVKKILQAKYSQAVVFKGGLTVHTSLDTRRQKYAEDAVFGFLNEKGDPDAGLVSIDPRNGHIVAMVGGENYSKNKFNLATQGRRQPGSAFKTFVLVTALEKGMPPYRYVNSSSPAVIQLPGRDWVVSNSEGSGHGAMSIENATKHSVNAVFARLIAELKPEAVAKVAKRMGIASPVPAFHAIALGGLGVTVLDMATAYGTLAANGVHYPPTAITKIVGPDGALVYEYKPKGKRVLDPSVAYAATKMLKGVITGGTATRANIGRPAAGKTGTSQNYRDAWFVGYTPQLVTAVWVGYYKTEKQMRNVHGRRGFGGTLAAPIWASYMRKALAKEKRLDFKSAPPPKYTWRGSWSRSSSSTVDPKKTKPKPKPASPASETPIQEPVPVPDPGPVTPPPPPDPGTDPSATP
ncbi:MAG: hypothetical protein C0418_04980 [Coriobacteriaceae bacterium]|nr:hypothetical protein [Coriobacteriaceae bacterium]